MRCVPPNAHRVCCAVQSEGITETFPAAGPVKTQIIGKDTKDKQEAAERVKDDMNYHSQK